jgi:AbrB family looped-hinge helix DNA binding protein
LGLKYLIDGVIVLRNDDRSMTTTTLSRKFQIVIPKTVREALKLQPGTVFNVVEYNGRIEIVPVRRPKEMRGFLRGIDTSVIREKDRL